VKLNRQTVGVHKPYTSFTLEGPVPIRRNPICRNANPNPNPKP